MEIPEEPQRAGSRANELRTWSRQVRARAADYWPEMPNGIDDRDADIWEALIAVADLAGGQWPEEARRERAKLGHPSLRWDERKQHHIDAACRAADAVELLDQRIAEERAGENRVSLLVKCLAERRLQDDKTAEHLKWLQLESSRRSNRLNTWPRVRNAGKACSAAGRGRPDAGGRIFGEAGGRRVSGCARGHRAECAAARGADGWLPVDPKDHPYPMQRILDALRAGEVTDVPAWAVPKAAGVTYAERVGCVLG